LREHTRSLFGPVLVEEQPPRCRERLIERSDQLVGDLPQRLWLVRQLADVVAVVDGTSTEWLTRVTDDTRSTGSNDRDVVDASVDVTSARAHVDQTEYVAPSTLTRLQLETDAQGMQRAEHNGTDGSGNVTDCPSTNRSIVRASSRARNAALIVGRSGPVGIGTSSCQRISLPRDSTPPLSCPCRGRAKHASNK
jgi:hypothetical protein